MNNVSDFQGGFRPESFPDDWGPKEIQHFLDTYGTKLQPTTTADESEEVELDEPAPIVMVAETYPVSFKSRNGLTLDSYIILNGASVPLRALWSAGRLVPFRAYQLEGSRRFPTRTIGYGVRITDTTRTIDVTEETYRTISAEWEQEMPLDEAPTNQQFEQIQSKVTITEADEVDRRGKYVLPE